MFRSVFSTAIIHLLCVVQVALAATPLAKPAETAESARPIAKAAPAPKEAPAPAPNPAPNPTPAPSPIVAYVGPKGPLAHRQVVNQDDARVVIAFAEVRFLEDYFTNQNISIQGLESFEFDFNKVLDANELIKFVERRSEFENWFNRSKLALLQEFLTKYPRTDVQRFMTAVYLKYRLQSDIEDPGALMEWLSRIITNPLIRDMSTGTAVIVVAVFAFALKTVHGAVVAGPMASFLTNFFEPLLRPIREKITITGARLFEKGGLWLNGKLFTSGDKTTAQNGVKDAHSKLSALQKMVDRLGYEMTPEQFHENLNRIHNTWNQVNQIWLRTQPTAFQNGRSILTDGVIIRHEMFSRALLVSIHAAETHLQSAEQMVDRMARSSLNPVETEAAGKQLEMLVEKQVIASERGVEEKAFVDKQVKVLTDRLASNGAQPDQITRLITLYERVYIFKRRAVTSLAAHMFHDVQYAEFNRELPRELRHASANMRKNFGLDFFHREFALEVRNMVEILGLRIGIAEKAVDATPVKDGAKRPEDARATDRMGELNRPAPETPAERARDAARRAGRR